MLFVVVDKKKVKTEVGITLRICLDTHLLKEKSFFWHTIKSSSKENDAERK